MTVAATEDRRSFRMAESRREGKKWEFDLIWKDKAGEEHTETFFCWPTRLPQTTTLRVTTVPSTGDLSPIFAVFEKAMQETPEEEEARNTENAARVQRADGERLLVPEYTRFFDFCEDIDHMIQAATLVEIMQVIIEKSTGFPTGGSRR